jgi:hypothetical protein
VCEYIGLDTGKKPYKHITWQGINPCIGRDHHVLTTGSSDILYPLRRTWRSSLPIQAGNCLSRIIRPLGYRNSNTRGLNREVKVLACSARIANKPSFPNRARP